MVDRVFIARICRILKIMVPRTICKEVSVACSNKEIKLTSLSITQEFKQLHIHYLNRTKLCYVF